MKICIKKKVKQKHHYLEGFQIWMLLISGNKILHKILIGCWCDKLHVIMICYLGILFTGQSLDCSALKKFPDWRWCFSKNFRRSLDFEGLLQYGEDLKILCCILLHHFSENLHSMTGQTLWVIVLQKKINSKLFPMI